MKIMFLKRLFCKKHKWKKIDYKEMKDDQGVYARITTYQCEKCGKKHIYDHKMPWEFGIY